MTNLEWLYSLDPRDLKAWFESEHASSATDVQQEEKPVGTLGRLADAEGAMPA